ncbi:MAG: hypothetical protein WAK17_25425 [Candidatus Nitrosopolaris sp.]
MHHVLAMIAIGRRAPRENLSPQEAREGVTLEFRTKLNLHAHNDI